MVEFNLPVGILVVLLLIASATAFAVKWVRLPYSIALVIVGLAIGVFHLLPAVQMTPDLILLVFLPALLFEASWNLELKELRGNWLPITVLVTFGVGLSAYVIGQIMANGAGLPWIVALTFGAMLSATDPISVIALFRKMAIDKRLTMLLEGESLFNDGTAVVLFNLVVAGVASQAALSLPVIGANFAVVVAGGVVTGLVLGLAAYHVTKYFDDHLLETTLTTILAYGSFLIANELHVSPVLAVITAGIVHGNYGSHSRMSATTRLAVNSFWEYAAFIVNSLVFLLIGMQIHLELLAKYSSLIGWGIVAILVARAVLVYGLSPLLSTRTSPWPLAWRHLLFWGALRGSLSMAMALSLPMNFPQREAIIVTVFGVVLFTLLVPGLTVEPLVRRFRLGQSDSLLSEYHAIRARLIINERAIEFLLSLRASKHISPRSFDRLLSELTATGERLHHEFEELHLSDSSIHELELNETHRHLLDVRKDMLVKLERQGVISPETFISIKKELDDELLALSDSRSAPDRMLLSEPSEADLRVALSEAGDEVALAEQIPSQSELPAELPNSVQISTPLEEFSPGREGEC